MATTHLTLPVYGPDGQPLVGAKISYRLTVPPISANAVYSRDTFTLISDESGVSATLVQGAEFEFWYGSGPKVSVTTDLLGGYVVDGPIVNAITP